MRDKEDFEKDKYKMMSKNTASTRVFGVNKEKGIRVIAKTT